MSIFMLVYAFIILKNQALCLFVYVLCNIYLLLASSCSYVEGSLSCLKVHCSLGFLTYLR
jgi:hypothetical protein